MSDLWPDIETDGDSSNNESSYEGRKYQENLDYQEQEEVLLVPRRNPRRVRRDDQRAFIQLKSDIERSKYMLFFIKHMYEGLTQSKW